MLELEVALDASAEQILFALRAGRFSNFSVPLGGAILRLFRRVVKQNFDSAGKLASPRWAPLSPRTLLEKARRGFGGKPIMRRTDRLYRSLTLGVRTSDSVVEVTPTSLRFGTSVEYAGFHQRGGRHLPRRQLLPDPMPATVGEECRQILRDWLVEGRGA